MDSSHGENMFTLYKSNSAVTKYQVTSGDLVKNPDNDYPSWDRVEWFSSLAGEFKMLWDRFRKFDAD